MSFNIIPRRVSESLANIMLLAQIEEEEIWAKGGGKWGVKSEFEEEECEPEEEEIWGGGGGNMRCQKSPLCCRLAYGAKFSKINPSGHIYVIKGMFSDQVMFMVRIPFNILWYSNFSLTTLRPLLTFPYFLGHQYEVWLNQFITNKFSKFESWHSLVNTVRVKS